MEYCKNLADLCIDILKILNDMYLSGTITENEYLEHIKLKLLYLKDNEKNQESINRGIENT